MPEPLELTIEKLVYGGYGLSRDNGRVVLTPLVLPGETIAAKPVDKLHARLIEVLRASPERVPAPCPYFGNCGGCHYQHAPYEYQLSQKLDILREVIRRVGKLEAPEPIRTVSGEAWGYRNRTQLQVRDGKIGYLRMGSHEMCPVDHCPISSSRLNEAIAAVSMAARDRRFPEFIRRIELFTNEEDVQFNVLESERPVARHFFDWIGAKIPGCASGAIEYPALDLRFRVGPRSFFQVNRGLVDALVREALAGAEGEAALDLYAGVGLFSLAMARTFSSVTAVESGASAAADLRFNAAAAGVAVETVRSDAEAYLQSVEKVPGFVLADPPREGLGKAAVSELLRLRPGRLHIVACDPATLARDMKMLIEGGYRLDRLTMVDLFPQTYHFETIAYLTPGD